MIIHTLWHRGDDDDAPWIVDAVDEYTIDNNCEFPPDYIKKRDDIHVRELIIDIPEDKVRALFDSPGVKAKVIETNRLGRACTDCGASDGDAHASGCAWITCVPPTEVAP